MNAPHSTLKEKTSVKWKAAVLAGLVTGTMFLIFEIGLISLTGASPWGTSLMFTAAIAIPLAIALAFASGIRLTANFAVRMNEPRRENMNR